MKVIGYLRVSTDAQSERGVGLDVQEKAILSWAKENGHTVAELFRDEGVSGSKDLDARPGIYAALDALERLPKPRGFVVYRLDRLARDLGLQERFLTQIQSADAQPFSVNESENAYICDDESDPTRKLIRQVLGAVAEFERGMIAHRMRSGREHRKEQGYYAFGAPPYGWQPVHAGPGGGKRLAPVPEEQTTLNRLRELKEKGLSTRKIGAVLTAEGHTTRRGGQWHSATVARLLKRLEQGPPVAAK